MIFSCTHFFVHVFLSSYFYSRFHVFTSLRIVLYCHSLTVLYPFVQIFIFCCSFIHSFLVFPHICLYCVCLNFSWSDFGFFPLILGSLLVTKKGARIRWPGRNNAQIWEGFLVRRKITTTTTTTTTFMCSSNYLSFLHRYDLYPYYCTQYIIH